jgi:hypothetical protein
MRAMRDGGAGLFVGGVGMADGDDHAEAARGVNAGHGAEKFGRNGEDARITGGSVDKALQKFGGRRL